jgi:uncharacterized protein (DUF952 family)
MVMIYKVCGQIEWAIAEAVGQYEGSADDARDGFIHFSTGTQLAGTLAKHFAGRDDLLLIAVAPEALGEALKWEPSRGGDLFPHLYAALPVSAALWAKPLSRDARGHHLIPPAVEG